MRRSGRITRSGAPCASFPATMALPMMLSVTITLSQAPGMSPRSVGGTVNTSTAMTRSALPRKRSNGNGLVVPPSMRMRPSTATGRNRPGMAIEAASAGRSGPAISGTSWRRCRSVAVTASGIFNRGKIRRNGLRQKLRTEFLGVDLGSLTESAGKQIGERAGARRDQAAGGFAPVVCEADDMVPDILAAHARRHKPRRPARRSRCRRSRRVSRPSRRALRSPRCARARARRRHRARARRFSSGVAPHAARLAGEFPGFGGERPHQSRLWRPQTRWSRCRREPGRRCLAGSQRGGRNCKRNRPADRGADRGRCASRKCRHTRSSDGMPSAARSKPTSEPVPASDGGICHCIR